jgi:hypothetical protein
MKNSGIEMVSDTTDNASYLKFPFNDEILNDQKFTRQVCAAHTCQFVIKDIYSVEKQRGIVSEAARRSATWIRGRRKKQNANFHISQFLKLPDGSF